MKLEDRALSLLGSGISAESVATALGVSASRISQLLSDPVFAEQVAALRYENLQQHNQRDACYDSIEDRLIEKLDKTIPLMMRPSEILNAIKVINGARRRGQSAPEQITASQQIVNITLPTAIVQKLTTNVHNQVVAAGEQDLITMQSGTLLSKIKAREELSYDDPTRSPLQEEP